jgi:hypothetical protein
MCSSPAMLAAKLAAGAKTPERNLPDPHGDSVLMYILLQHRASSGMERHTLYQPKSFHWQALRQ